MKHRSASLRALALLGLLTLGCARKVEPPVANQSPAPPRLGGSVLLLPVQSPGQDKLDAELAYWLPESAPQVKWVLPAAIDRTLSRNPGMGIKPRELDVSAFRRAQVKRIGDPLFGDLRRLAAIFDTRLALVPVGAGARTTADGKPTLEVALALIDTSFGDVLWYGIVGAEEAAATAQRVANLFAPPKTQL